MIIDLETLNYSGIRKTVDILFIILSMDGNKYKYKIKVTEITPISGREQMLTNITEEFCVFQGPTTGFIFSSREELDFGFVQYWLVSILV